MKIRRSLRNAGTVVALGAAIALWALPVTSASASTLDGTATLTNPNTNTALTSGGSTTVFTVVLTPAPADCSGDTASDGYHVYSYLLPQATSITSNNFSTGSPSEGLGLVDADGYYGPANTAPTTGQIISIPTSFEWADLLSLGETAAELDNGSSAVWNAGIACANASGAVTDYWNTQVTFTKSTSDPNGFVWSAGPGSLTPEVSQAVTLPIAGAVVLGGGLWFSRRRSRRKALLAQQTAG
jgi:LPXTG-motif cell wall-anchored protein